MHPQQNCAVQASEWQGIRCKPGLTISRPHVHWHSKCQVMEGSASQRFLIRKLWDPER